MLPELYKESCDLASETLGHRPASTMLDSRMLHMETLAWDFFTMMIV